MTKPANDRPLTLRFVGDPYGANLTKICNWLAYEARQRSPEGTSVEIVPGDAGAANVLAVARGDADLSAITPSAVATAAIRGIGPFEGDPQPHLRALGELPHLDGFVLAARRDFGVASIAELREKQLPIRITTAEGGEGRPYAGYVAERVLVACGIEPDRLRSWGGEVITRRSPYECLADVASGEADAVLHEAIMEPQWHQLADTTPLTFLSFGREVLAAMEEQVGCGVYTIPGGYLTGLDQDFDTIDFTGFLVIVRDDMPDDVATMLTAAMTETVDRFIALNYGHLKSEGSAIAFPVERENLIDSPIPLHRAAAKQYGLVSG